MAKLPMMNVKRGVERWAQVPDGTVVVAASDYDKAISALRKAHARMPPLMCRDWDMEEIEAILTANDTGTEP